MDTEKAGTFSLGICPYCERPLTYEKGYEHEWRFWYLRSEGRCTKVHNRCAELGDLQPCEPSKQGQA